MTNNPIRVIIADDHEILRDGMRAMLKKSTEIELIAEAGNGKELLELSRQLRPDVVITDPPRAGMHEDVCKMLLKASPEKIIYVSCNPATQARDLKILFDTYEIVAVQPVDMFPHTMHVENVVSLVKRS